MDIAREQDRMMTMMQLDQSFIAAQMRAMPGTCTPADAEALVQLRERYRTLLSTATPSDMLVTADALNERIADVTDWIGRAFDTLNDAERAVSYYEEAKALYEGLGKSDMVASMEDKIGDLGILSHADLDSEITRLRRRLDDTTLGELERADALIKLGEVLSKAQDDFEAEKVLVEAEKILDERPNPGRDDLLGSLGDSIGAIMEGFEGSGADTPIVEAVRLRALHQRLYFALGNVYRDTDPARAKEYEAKLAEFDAPGGSVDTEIVSKLMEQLRKGFGP